MVYNNVPLNLSINPNTSVNIYITRYIPNDPVIISFVSSQYPDFYIEIGNTSDPASQLIISILDYDYLDNIFKARICLTNNTSSSISINTIIIVDNQRDNYFIPEET